MNVIQTVKAGLAHECWRITFLVILLTSSFYTALPTHASSPDPVSPVGIEIARIHIGSDVEQIKQANASWTRIAGIWWPDVEPVEGVRNWDALKAIDAELALAYANGLQTVLVIRGTPFWAQQYEGVSCGPIRHAKLRAFAYFMSDLVQRYSAAPYSVKYWEIGNEPDIDRKLVEPDSLWGCWGDDSDAYYGGAAYAELLAYVYPRIKAVDSEALVLVGGLVLDCLPTRKPGCADEQHRRPARFLEGVLRAGGAAHFDGISFHSYDYYQHALGNYSNANFGSSSSTTGPVSVVKAAYIRQLLKRYRADDKFILNTEYALLCSKCVEPNTTEYEWTKAYYVAQANTAAIAHKIRANIWFRLTYWQGTALINADLTPTLAYTATRAVATFLADAKYVRALTSARTRSTAVQGYEFRKDNKVAWVVWSTDGLTHTLRLRSTPAVVRDVLGHNVQTDNRNLVLQPLDKLLYYIEW